MLIDNSGFILKYFCAKFLNYLIGIGYSLMDYEFF